MSDFDEAALAAWMQNRVPGFHPPLASKKFPGGQSNPTYRLDTSDRNYVLRRKPFGALLPSAHAVEREYRVLAALKPTGFPVPQPITLCKDATVLGSAFYLMELVDGRSFWDGTLPELRPAERRSVYESMIDTLAQLHNIDHERIGLGDFGAPGNYFARQIERWTKQYRASQTEEIDDIEHLIAWLPRTLPEQKRTTIIHGDYRIDNLLYDIAHPAVAAVLDWELATIGDPLADFSYLAMQWVLPADGRAGLAGVDLGERGIPTLDEAIARYCAATARDGLPDLHWYFAFNLFRLAAIVQGIKKRSQDGTASSPNAAALIKQIVPLARLAREQAQHGG